MRSFLLIFIFAWLAITSFPDISEAKTYKKKSYSTSSHYEHHSAQKSYKTKSGHKSRKSQSRKSYKKKSGRKSTKAQGVARDKHGKIKRSEKAKHSFKKKHPCPSTGKSDGPCPGYVIDHVKPLKRGGADDPSNMQWQTKEAAKQKDKTE